MERHLRLADRQGLLYGPDISVVQAEALSILEYQDQIEKAKVSHEAFKLALAARENYSPEKIFPEYYPTDVVDDESEVPDGEDVEYDYSAVEWKGPSDVDKAELAEIMKLLQEASGTVGMDRAQQMTGGGWV